LFDSVLNYFEDVPIVQTVQAVQIASGIAHELNGAQRLNEAKRMNVLNDKLHSPHCRACKEHVREILMAIYGECRVNHSFPWPAYPEAYHNTAIGDLLERIRAALGNFRDRRGFIKSPQVPPCDYFISDPPFIVEFDESQHFTGARLVTLANYPVEIPVGFPLPRWRDLCLQIDAKDDDPYDRDERRAWYDTLRDLVPSLYGFKPTARLYAEEFKWCSLDTRSSAGIATFRDLLRDRLPAKTS
jgi:hypothetical protein